MAVSIVGAVVSLVGEKLLDCTIEPIKRRYNYLRCFNSNIDKLREEARNLKDARYELQMRVNVAKENAEEILPEVKSWLDDVNKIQVKKTGIEREINNIQGGYFAAKSRLLLSKEAENTTRAMKELQNRCRNFNVISFPLPLATTTLVPLEQTYDFQSRKQIEEDIIKALREFNMVGLCGMGGIGKTTMAKRVMERVKKEGLFDETVMVVISQTIDLWKIQHEIAEQLGLKLEKDPQYKAFRLYSRLTGGRRILMVLDDVWDYLELEELGIPCNVRSGKCAILLTSRDRGVLKQMDVRRVCQIQTLSDEEAWHLFKQKVGTCLDNQNLLSLAQAVAKQCKGLPVALVNVAMALKGKGDKLIWENVLRKLESSYTEDLPRILDGIYNPLYLSYDFLGMESARSIFLLCCLFPEDHDIPLDYLIACAMGLDVFEGLSNLKEARMETWSLVDMLRSRFLLLEGRDDSYVKMHDAVRDVAIFIASEERRIKCDDCTWISSFIGERIEISARSSFLNLRLLLIDESIQVNDNFFEGMRDLNVVSMTNHSLRSLPYTTQLLKDLRTLVLHSCKSLETMSVIGELENLEILICVDCDSVEELPVEIGRLYRLRLLDLSYCRMLKTIVPGIISRLVRLEELKMVQSFDKWETENNKAKDRKNVVLRELESLSNLTCLEIEVKDYTLAAEQICLSGKIEKFDITIGDCRCCKFKSNRGSWNKMDVHLPRAITLGDWLLRFLRDSRFMSLEGECCGLELGQALQNMRWLTLRECSTMKKLVNITTLSNDDGRCSNTISTAIIFPHLEYLELYNLCYLEEIYDIDSPIPNVGFRSYIAFKNLKELVLEKLPRLKHLWKRTYQNVISPFNNISCIYINECHSLCNLFPLAMANDCLLPLERVEIWECKMMEQVFFWNEEGENKKDIGQESHRIVFPKLKKLRLDGLPNLTTFCKGIECIEFPLLTEMEIGGCSRMKSLVSNTTSSEHANNQGSSQGISHDHDNDVYLHLFCEPEKVACGSLTTVKTRGNKSNSSNRIFCCYQITTDLHTGIGKLWINSGNIRSLFSFSIARNLLHLRELSIHDCLEMVKVIEDEDEKHVSDHEITYLFPMLQILDLHNLPKLKNFCEWRCDLGLPSLKDVRIVDCPEMERFTLGSLTTPKLETISFGVKFEESFCKWEAKLKGIETQLEGIKALDEALGVRDEFSFRHATNLLISEDSILGLEQISFPSNIGKYDITISEPQDFGFSLVGFEKKMHLHLPREITLGNWIHQRLRSVDYLLLKGEGSNDLDLGQARNLRLLIFRDCSTVKKLVNITSSTDGRRFGANTVFPLLEYIDLYNLPNLEEICGIDGSIPDEWFRSNSFKNLKKLNLRNLPALEHLSKSPCQNIVVSLFNPSSICISRCGSLRNLSSLALANDCILQLERLRILDCEMMEQIFLWNEEEENKKDIGQESHQTTVLPNLKSLVLSNLPNLTTFCKKIESIEFHILTQMFIENCPHLRSFVSTTSSIRSGNSQNSLGGI